VPLLSERMRYYSLVVPARIGLELRELLPAFGNRHYRRFCIISPGRAGSEMLVQRCNSHAQVRCYGEVLAHNHITWLTSSRPPTDVRALTLRDRNPVRFLERHVWHSYPKSIQAVGLKLLYPHLLKHRAALEPIINGDPDLMILWLDRRNRFEGCLSRLMARRTRVFFVNDARPVPDVAPVTVDPRTCERSLTAVEFTHQLIAELLEGTTCLKLYYEDLVEEAEACNTRICRFLQVEEQPLTHRSRKIAQGALRQRVANFGELKDHFRGSRWEAYFADE